MILLTRHQKQTSHQLLPDEIIIIIIVTTTTAAAATKNNNNSNDDDNQGELLTLVIKNAFPNEHHSYDIIRNLQ